MKEARSPDVQDTRLAVSDSATQQTFLNECGRAAVAALSKLPPFPLGIGSRREKRIPSGAALAHSLWIFRSYPDSPGSRALSHLLIRRYCIFLAEGQAWNVALPQ
jgi:hypothetical protein